MIEVDANSVLLVDDDHKVHASLGRFFKELGYQVIHAYTLEQAIEACARFSGIRILLVDKHLKGCADYDGLRFLKMISALPLGEPMIKILMGTDVNSGEGSWENFTHYERKEGVKLDGLLEKPICEKALRAALMRI